MASHWNVSLTWKIFVGCVIAVLARQLLDGWVFYWYNDVDDKGAVTATSPFSQMSVWVRFAFETVRTHSRRLRTRSHCDLTL
jgi:hypothetical protein